jgi:hypothetical protein
LRSALWPDVPIHDRDRIAARDRDVPGPVLAPLDAESVAGVTEDPLYVERAVGEEVARIGVGLLGVTDPVRDAAAVGVDEAAEQSSWMMLDDAFLPGLEDDPALVLYAGAMLWEEVRPVRRPLSKLRIVVREMPVAREMAEIFRPFADKTSTSSTSAGDLNCPVSAVRRAGFEPACPEGQRLLRAPCQPVAAPPLAQPF